eukprot:TRINITY_DN1122_c0_g1_i2.p1 TRINITY_DN1122_c0_g1~~TRINITY_DN1122_c0_g1_i2.p1  ORF type:complete len:237 (-),score=13.45 TRINITY_DN1122_c0_g1_i2:262-972(-)
MSHWMIAFCFLQKKESAIFQVWFKFMREGYDLIHLNERDIQGHEYLESLRQIRDWLVVASSIYPPNNLAIWSSILSRAEENLIYLKLVASYYESTYKQLFIYLDSVQHETQAFEELTKQVTSYIDNNEIVPYAVYQNLTSIVNNSISTFEKFDVLIEDLQYDLIDKLWYDYNSKLAVSFFGCSFELFVAISMIYFAVPVVALLWRFYSSSQSDISKHPQGGSTNSARADTATGGEA